MVLVNVHEVVHILELQMLSAPAKTQTWVHSALWGVHYHQFSHASIYEQLNLVAHGTCDVSNVISAAHRSLLQI